MKMNTSEARRRYLKRLATSMGVSSTPPTSNNTRWIPAMTKPNRPAVFIET